MRMTIFAKVGKFRDIMELNAKMGTLTIGEYARLKGWEIEKEGEE